MRHRSPVAPALLFCAALVGCPGPDFDRGTPPELDSPPSVFAEVPGGFFRAPVTVGLRCNDDRSGCSVYYTLDGSTPTDRSSVYRAPLTIDGHVTVRFFGRDSAGQGSSVEAQEYFVDTEEPLALADPAGGAYAYTPWVSLSCSDGAGSGCAAIRYTLDGSAPDASSPLYEAPIGIADRTELRFVAFDRSGNASEEGRESYRVDVTAPATSESPAAGAYTAPIDVALACTDGDGLGCFAIHYTVDGSSPTTGSPVYDGPLHVAQTTTVRFLGVDAIGHVELLPHEARYVIDATPPTTTLSPGAVVSRYPVTATLMCSDAGSGCLTTFYTTDGSEPGWSSYQYHQQVYVPVTTTLRYRSIDQARNLEPVREARIVVDGVAPTVTASPPGGGPFAPLDVALACDDPGGSGCAEIHYTADGTLPTSSSPTYAAPIHLAGWTNLQYFAVDVAGNASPVRSATYLIDGIAPRIASSTPRDGAVGADPSAPVTLVFDEALDPTSSLAASVDGVAATLAYDAGMRTATVTPASPLSGDAAHVVEVTGVRDVSGNTPAKPAGIRFRTRGDVLPVGGAGSASIVPQGLAYDAAGNALATYRADTGKGHKLFVARYDAAAGTWSAPAEIFRERAAGAAPPISAVASTGDGFLLAWSTGIEVRARLLDASGAGDELPPLWSGAATELRVATGGQGYAVVVNLGGLLSARVYDAATHLWSLPEDIGGGASISVAADGASYVATYLSGDAASQSVWYAFRGVMGWGGRPVYSTKLPVGAPAIAARGGNIVLAFPVVDALGAVLASVGDASDGQGGGALPDPVVVANAARPANVSVAVSDTGVALVFQGTADTGTTTFGMAHDGTRWTAAAAIASAPGAPLATSLASSGAGFLALAAAGSPDAPTLVAVARTVGAWSTAVAASSSEAAGRDALLARKPAGYGIAFAQDDGSRDGLIVRAHAGDAGAAALGVAVEVGSGGPGAPRNVRLAADGAGGTLAVWVQEHRGGPAVFASRGVGGVYGAAALVSSGADSPSVAAIEGGFVVAYRRGDGCEVRTWSGDAVSGPARIDDASGGPCTAPAVASTGVRHVVAWRAGALALAAVFDGTAWTPPQTLSTTASGDVAVAARRDQLAVAWATSSSVMFRATDGTPTGWSVASPATTIAGASAPSLVAGDAGFAVAWVRAGYAYASVVPSGRTAPGYAATLGYGDVVALAARAGGFLAAFGPRGGELSEVEYTTAYGGWKSPFHFYSSAATLARVAGGARGYGLLLLDKGGALRGASFVDGVWSPFELVRPSPQDAPALAWDGETYVSGWTEADPSDTTLDRVLLRRGL